MATYEVEAGKLGVYDKTLTANTVDTVKIAGACEAVEVTAENGSARFFLTTDGTAPTVGGAGTVEIPASTGTRVIQVDSFAGETLEIKLISSGTPEYSVRRSQVAP